ncbi:MAG: molybdenum cofactor guanylyltransferase [Sphingobacteriaceae bacterium]|nr:MAG: molybdenum cofactor guanylyltransferase [Sphingobacteriaceae bacterium]
MKKALKGLVLAGGKSSRMGTNKAEINWHGKQQQYHLADLLKRYCDEVFISCRQNQQQTINTDYPFLTDTYADAGPLAALLTAFEKYPDCGWMIMACDIPLLDQPTLAHLVEQRDDTKIATVFTSILDELPEPLIGIWEPESYHHLKIQHQKQQFSLRKILTANGAKTIKAPNDGALINVNTPEDAAYIKKLIG